VAGRCFGLSRTRNGQRKACRKTNVLTPFHGGKVQRKG
jgi:hypothetical protein